MKILVCITHVPDTTSKIAFTDDNKSFDGAGVQFIIGPYDDYALARAVELKEQHGGKITVVNVGEADSDPTIRKAFYHCIRFKNCHGSPPGDLFQFTQSLIFVKVTCR